MSVNLVSESKSEIEVSPDVRKRKTLLLTVM